LSGLVPAIHVFVALQRFKDVDAIGPRACPRSAALNWRKSSELDLR
jgi:hypothetical protein